MPDYEGYIKSLEKILEGVTRDYWASYIDINRHQVNIGRAYLWVSIALIGVYAATYKYFHKDILETAILVILGAVSFILAFAAFGICLYAIPARKGYKAIPKKGWGEFSHQAYHLLKEGSKQVYATFLSQHISKIDYAFEYNFKTNQKRAKLLRFTSWLLIASFLFALVPTSIATIRHFNKSLKENKTMVEETKPTASEPNASEPEPTLDVPEPPPPADIGDSGINTHSQKPPNDANVFTTEIKTPEE